MTYRVRISGLLLMLVLGLLLVACGGGEEAAEQAPAPTVAAAEPAADEPAAAEPTDVPPTAVPQPTDVPPTKAPEPTSVPEPTEEPAAETDSDPLASILGAQRAYLGAESLRTTMSSYDAASDMSFETVVEFVPPDRYRIVNDFTQMISIGDKTYVSMDGENWQELPMNMGDMMEGLPTITSDEEELDAYLEEFQVSMSNVDYRGKEELDGRDVKVYEYDSSANLGSMGVDQLISSHSIVYIGEDDGRVYKAITETKDESGAVTTSVTIVYEYDLPLEIEAPIGN